VSEDPSVVSSSFGRNVDSQGLFSNEEIHPDKSVRLSFKDNELVERTVAELASRPHAYLLLELISDGLVMQKQKADTPIDGNKKPERSPGAVNPRPASDRTET
jgi:hypothetical protein